MKRFLHFFSKILIHAFFAISVVFSSFLFRLAEWFSRTFSISIREVIFTVKSPLKGADTNFLKSAADFVNISSLILIFAICIVFSIFIEKIFSKLRLRIFLKMNSGFSFKINVYFLIILFIFGFSVFEIKSSFKFADEKAKISEYLALQKSQSRIYEEKYVFPTAQNVIGNGKNLILIYMESMETTYADEKSGGKQSEINYIPNLTALAGENVNFSTDEKMGGFRACSGAGWTMGSLFAQSAGVPFAFPVEGNSMNSREKFASGITTIGDILKEKGYSQEFLCGSDGNFAGRKQFFEQHGSYKVFDLFTAREKDYIPQDYQVWWGFEDEILYKIAKDEILSLSEKEEPFNFTMLTVDTHHVGGYKCNICQDKFGENLANVVDCADRQVFEFVRWIQSQDFYKDCVIVIVGDHPRMDSILVNDTPYKERTVFNCFINSQKIAKNQKSREFCTLDMFPTTLSALGFEIAGNRLGLGTDLFSDSPTLSEEMGYDEFNAEISKFSEFYLKNFP